MEISADLFVTMVFLKISENLRNKCKIVALTTGLYMTLFKLQQFFKLSGGPKQRFTGFVYCADLFFNHLVYLKPCAICCMSMVERYLSFSS